MSCHCHTSLSWPKPTARSTKSFIHTRLFFSFSLLRLSGMTGRRGVAYNVARVVLYRFLLSATSKSPVRLSLRLLQSSYWYFCFAALSACSSREKSALRESDPCMGRQARNMRVNKRICTCTYTRTCSISRYYTCTPYHMTHVQTCCANSVPCICALDYVQVYEGRTSNLAV